jgi:poly-gamma-glutamate capsule biosynthesis protein CapA/YwtB (metallophosphatase superfamily)
MRRRDFLRASGVAALTAMRAELGMGGGLGAEGAITLFVSGDVMTGRGVDQILPHPGRPHLYESYVRSARDYVALAEAENGPIAKPVDFAHIWGDALEELSRRAPDVRIVNLETAVTVSEEHWPGKGIHYRMHPKNVHCLTAGGIDCCVLANNHVLDWGRPGLEETLSVLHRAGLRTAGAGRDQAGARTPAAKEIAGRGRVLVFGFGVESSGIPGDWAATEHRSGVDLLPDFSEETLRRIGEQVAAVKRRGDVAVASIHWGANWGYAIPGEHRDFAHRLIDHAGIDLVHGHSSHHPLGIERYRGRLILYGCGDLLNDYEGISGYEQFRGDLALLYFASVDPFDGRLLRLDMVPVRVRRMRLNHATAQDAAWLRETLDRESALLGCCRVAQNPDRSLTLRWTGR